MDDYNAKKSRAQKFRQDKYKDRHKKPPASGPQVGKSVVKNVTQEKSLKEKDDKVSSDIENSDSENMDSKEQSFSRRKMVSNWDRYEETVLNRYEEEAEPSGALFEELLSMPISGGHLQMKHEHEWGKEKSELQMPWFQLDIKDVEKNLATIPFLKRQSLPRCIFNDSHLQRMVTRAKQNAASLIEVNEGILKMQNLCVASSSKNEASSKNKFTENEQVSDKNATGTQKEFAQDSKDLLNSDDLDSLLALDISSNPGNVKPSEDDMDFAARGHSPFGETGKSITPPQRTSPVSGPVTKTSPSQPTASLDDWLDSILDD